LTEDTSIVPPAPNFIGGLDRRRKAGRFIAGRSGGKGRWANLNAMRSSSTRMAFTCVNSLRSTLATVRGRRDRGRKNRSRDRRKSTHAATPEDGKDTIQNFPSDGKKLKVPSKPLRRERNWASKQRRSWMASYGTARGLKTSLGFRASNAKLIQLTGMVV